MRSLWTAMLLVAVMAWFAPRAAPPAAAQRAITLPDAMGDGLVEAVLESTGAASGSAATVRLRRLVPDELTISVPTGLVLVSSDPERQDVGVLRLLGETAGGRSYRPATVIVLADDAEHTYIIEAYCLHAHKDNPRAGMPFTIAGLADAPIVAVLEAAAQNPDAKGQNLAIQAAVWAATDDITREEMNAIGYHLADAQLDLARAIIAAAGLAPEQYQLFHAAGG